MAGIVLQGVTKVFGNEVVAVDDVSFEIGDGEFMVLVGPSGCGKSTILRLLAGLDEVTAGEIFIGEDNVTDRPPKERDVAMVFQNYALYPHLTVEENIGFGLRIRHVDKAEVRRRSREAAKALGLERLLDRRPAELSGGQRQRVAMGRAMVREPKAFLMDEPLSNLDAKLRVQMRTELARLHDRLRTTTVYVTHDQIEAMTLGHRVAVLKDGLLQQVAAPRELYHAPHNLFVAAFIGSPPMNLVEADVRGRSLEFAGFSVPVPEAFDLSAHEGGRLILGFRPSDMEDASVRPAGDRPSIDVTVDVTEELGSEINVLFAIDAPPVETDDTIAAATEDGTAEDAALITGGDRAVLCARVDARSRVTPGGSIRLTLDPERFLFFEPDTGDAVRGTIPVAAPA